MSVDIFTWTSGQPGIIEAAGLLLAVRTSVAIGSVSSMTVNGNPQTVINFADFAGQVPTGPTDYFWFFGAGGNVLSATYAASIPAGAVIVVTYTPYTSTNVSGLQYGTALAPSGGLGTCGSGRYQGVMQVQNISSIDTLNAIAAAELARIGGVPTIVTFGTNEPGLQPGQLLSVNVPLSDAANLTLLITAVTGEFIPPKLNTRGSFKWRVEARSNLDPGNTTNWWERLVQRTVNPLPIYQQDVYTFTDSDISTPRVIQRTGLITELNITAQTPPIDQTAVFTLTVNGVVISFTASYPSTQTANSGVTVTIPKASQVYAFKGQIATAALSYTSVGGSAMPISGYSFNFLVAM